jgi:hypothetical protein
LLSAVGVAEIDHDPVCVPPVPVKLSAHSAPVLVVVSFWTPRETHDPVPPDGGSEIPCATVLSSEVAMPTQRSPAARLAPVVADTGEDEEPPGVEVPLVIVVPTPEYSHDTPVQNLVLPAVIVTVMLEPVDNGLVRRQT